MKRVFIVSILLLLIGCASNAVNTEPPELIEPTEYVVPTEPKEPGEPKGPTGAAMSVNQVVEAACGQCQFEMTERSGCDLAVRIDGKSYFVDGTNIHEHGDEHADDGFCEVIRSANVKGEIIEGRFKSESFILIK
tara:strand:+ start:265 stop:669 length:405 start_codon:yes stop_codon:yes gene_type:complete